MAVAPPPIYSDAVDATTKKANIDWTRWFQSLTTAFGLTAGQVGAVDLSTQAASIAATAVSTPTLAPGLYRVSYYARVTRAATTSSSLMVTIGWTDSVACSVSGAAVTGNTTATVSQGSVILSADEASSITYATTYASVGATTMTYALFISVEALP